MENEIYSYDYKTVKTKRALEAIICDSYENLGWEFMGSSTCEGSPFHENLSFKRNRKIANKVQLLKLQEKIDNSILTIETLQSKQKNAGVPEAITTGVVGALVLGGGMSMVMTLSGIGYMIGGIALGVVGIGLGFVGWWIHNVINKKKSAKISTLLEAEFDKLADLCEQAHKLAKGDNE